MSAASVASAASEPMTAACIRRARCPVCKHRLGMLDQTVNRCRCGETYCSAHRSPEDHACGFSFRAAGSGALSLEKITGIRLAKI